VGGRYRIVSTQRDGQTHDVAGEYQEVLPPRRLVFTWAWHSTPERASRVSLDFLAQDGGTMLCLVHGRFFDEQARINHARGWQAWFERFDALLQFDTQEV
jgi:uncharacterized protein YndB with AHSA1/START domain